MEKNNKDATITETAESALQRDFGDRKRGRIGWIRTHFKSTSFKQLDRALGPFELELETLILCKKEGEDSFWAEKSQQAVTGARYALEIGDVQLGWGYFYKAQLFRLHLMDNGRLLDCAKDIFNTAEEKLGDSEKKTVREQIGQLGKDGIWIVNPAGVNVNSVSSALETVQEHYIDLYTQKSIALFQLNILAVVVAVLSGFLIWSLVSFHGLPVPNDGFFLLSVVLFGGLGGSVSGMITVANGLPKTDIPEQSLSAHITLARPIVGAAAAVVISMFLMAKIITIGELTPTLVWAVSFAAGFSERVLLGAIAKVP